MFNRILFKQIWFRILIVFSFLLSIFTAVYFFYLYQLPEHQQIREKMYSIEHNDISQIKELKIIAEEYEVNVMKIEQYCGSKCSKYWDFEGDYDRWENCSQECDVRNLKDKILSKTWQHESLVENWWSFGSYSWSLRASFRDFRQYLQGLTIEIMQDIEKEKEFQKLENQAMQNIPKIHEEIDKVKSIASKSDIDMREEIIFCKDKTDTEFNNVENFQSRLFKIKCEYIRYCAVLYKKKNYSCSLQILNETRSS